MKNTTIKKIQLSLLYLTLFLLPFNMRFIFNFEEIANIEGFREHLTKSVFLFDITALLFLLTTFFIITKKICNQKKAKPTLNSCTKNKDSEQILKKEIGIALRNPVFYFMLILLINITTSQDKTISLINTFRFIEIIILYLAIKKTFTKNNSVVIYSIYTLVIAGFLQSIIALLQFIFQKSIGLKFLGESIISPTILGVAKFDFAGEKLLRAYGTFPHPNILGLFLFFTFVCSLWLIMNKKYLKFQITKKVTPEFTLIIALSFILFGIIVSYSRSIILVTTILSLIFIFINRLKFLKIYQKICKILRVHLFFQGALGIILIFAFLFSMFNILSPRLCISNCTNDSSTESRILYNKIASNMIKDYPLTGVGFGNFTSKAHHFSPIKLENWQKQPAHNLLLLITSEIGILGLIVFLLIIAKVSFFKKSTEKLSNNPFAIAFLLFIGLSLLDHYFWTTVQGQIVFWLLLAFLESSRKIRLVSISYTLFR